MSNEVINQLNNLIADFTVFYQKLRHYHWNVKGKHFFKLHEKFEEIYDEVGDLIDELAERLIGLDGIPFHTLDQMLQAASIEEDPEMPIADQMVSLVIKDIETLNDRLLAAIDVAEDAEDRTTVNMLDEIHDGLEGHLWMLKSWQAG
jgi:starvation-inducible DNA-binding protein